MTARTLYVAEPPAEYFSGRPAVIDCSVFIAMLFDEPQRDDALRLSAGRALHAPWLLDHEIANVAERKRRGGVAAERVAAAVSAYLEHDVTFHRTSPDLVMPLAATHAISTYDAAYLELAARLRAPLLTFDRQLGQAAMRHFGAPG